MKQFRKAIYFLVFLCIFFLARTCVSNAQSSSNQVWVMNESANNISQFNPDGTPGGPLITGNGMNGPNCVATYNNIVWVGNLKNDSISRFNLDGTSAGSVITGNGLNNPEGMAVVGSQIWVNNYDTDSISRFNPNGTSAGSPLVGNGVFGPVGIAVVGTQVWVVNADTTTNSISRFNFDGTSAGSPITGNGLSNPIDIGVVGSKVWVTNVASNTVSRFNFDGSVGGSQISGNGLNKPSGVLLVGSKVWVTNENGNSISLFWSDGSSAGSPITGNSMNHPTTPRYNLPPPTSTPIPTPTPTPATNTISGTIYKDLNANTYYASPDTPYNTSTVQIQFWQAGVLKNTVSTTTGTYNSGPLPQGTYDVKFTSLPSGYYMTYPLNGPPPTFTVTIGSTCSNPLAIHDMSCTSGNIINLNFGINNQKPWLQSYCADMRMDQGFIDPISPYASCTINGLPASGPYAITNTSCANPGMIFTGNQPYDLNGQKANVPNTIIGGYPYPETFSPSTIGTIRTSFDYMLSTAKQSALTPTDMKTICQNGNLNKKNGSSGCILSNPPHGLYLANDDVDLNAITFPANQNYVFLINGKLTLYGRVLVSGGSTLIVSAKKDIVVDSTVGGSSGSTQGDIEGLYSSDQSFRINSTGTCPDKHLTIAGSVVVNAGHTGGTFVNSRSLCSQNTTCPTITTIHRPDMILNAPSFIKHLNSTWQESIP